MIGTGSRIFTVTALAIAAERANAIGVVRLTCLPEGLEIELVRAAGFAEGFAPSSVAEQVSFTVPYTAVRGLVRHGRTLALALDPAIAAPHNRFALVRFTDDPAAALAHTYRARLVARWVSYLLPAPLGLLAVAAAPSGLVSGALGTASLGLLAALVSAVALGGLVRWLTWGGPISDQYRDAFEIELSRRLGLLPAKPLVTSPWDALPGEPGDHGELGEKDPSRAPQSRRPVVWAIVAVVTLGLVGVMAFLKRYATARSVRPPSAELAAGIGAAASAMARIEVRLPGDDRPRCACPRADSPLWHDGIPALSVLLFAQPDDGSGVVSSTPHERKAKSKRRGRGRRRDREREREQDPDKEKEPIVDFDFDFDLAVVNNSARPVRDIRVVLTFARRDRHDQRVGVTDRGLFWGSTLGPGRAIKWHVRAPGTEMRIETSIPGTLDEASEAPASPDAFFDLLSSRYRVVRIHGAMMLAYLRDPRAETALRALGSAAPLEVPILARIQRAAAPIIACDITRAPARLEACIFNGESMPAAGLALREVPEDTAAPARVFPIEGAVPVHEGARVSFPLEGASPPAEIFVERSAPKPVTPPPPTTEPVP